MAFVIIKTFLDRIEKLEHISIKQNIFDEMIQYNVAEDELQQDVYKIEALERPPIIQNSDYRGKFHRPTVN